MSTTTLDMALHDSSSPQLPHTTATSQSTLLVVEWLVMELKEINDDAVRALSRMAQMAFNHYYIVFLLILLQFTTRMTSLFSGLASLLFLAMNSLPFMFGSALCVCHDGLFKVNDHIHHATPLYHDVCATTTLIMSQCFHFMESLW